MPESINTALIAAQLWPALNENPASPIFWLATDPYLWINQAAQELARQSAVFVERDETLQTLPGQADYTLPARHIANMQLDVAGQVLRPAAVADVEAIDEAWPATSGTPKRVILDTKGLGQATLYPIPNTGFLTIGLIEQRIPPTISVTSPTLAAPSCVREYFYFAALMRAHVSETKASKTELVDWLKQTTDLLGQVIKNYWG